ncbi:dipeptide/oligopeptide/nickel ABC transporter ATP-binding protein [Enterococcus ratti]|uniref:ABC transporter ATP-binding protein n=1 Tax=Enterococcus ratti TaxID=150033 RepID=UPI003512CAD0
MKKLELKKVTKVFKVKKKYGFDYSVVLDQVSFSIAKGETVALLGPSGSGKTTLSRVLLGIESINQGELFIDNEQVASFSHSGHIKCSIVFQNYRSSVNPSYTIKDVLEEVLGKVEEAQYTELLEKVGLSSINLNRKCTTLSGGEIQRVCVARGIATKADLLIFDEAFRSLDLVHTFHFINLLKTLKKEYGFAYLIITHDIKLACYLCERLLFLKDGTIIEDCQTKQLKETTSEYVQTLLSLK